MTGDWWCRQKYLFHFSSPQIGSMVSTELMELQGLGSMTLDLQVIGLSETPI